MRPKTVILVFLLTMVASRLSAQDTTFSRYMAADGLSDNNVLCALRDSYGFVWLGTNNGLNRFDGTQNTIYRNMVDDNASLENNTITALFEHGGDVWFGGSFGLYVYHRQTDSFSRFNKKTRYGVSISSTVSDIAGSQNGLIWIATLGQGLFVYDPAADALSQDSRHGAFITDIFTEDDSPVFLTTLQGQILKYSQAGHYELQFAIPGYLPDKHNLCIANIGHRLYIGSEHGLYTISQGETNVSRVASISDGIHALAAQGTDLLIGTDHGLLRYATANGHLERFSDNDELGDLKVNALLWDADSTLWVLTQTGGVCYFPTANNGVLAAPLPSHARSRTVRALAETPGGDLWIGTDAGLFYYDHAAQHISQPTAQPALQQDISSLMLDGDQLWIGTQNSGIIVLDTKNGSLRRYQYSADRSYTVPTNEITCLLRTSQGDIYVGTSWGLNRYDRATENFMWYYAIGSQTNVTCLAEDKSGYIWVATSNHGLFRFQQISSGAGFSNYTYHHDQPSSLPGNDITTVFCDHEGTIWIALNGGGLYRFMPATDDFEPFGASVPMLQDQQVYSIAEDSLHNLWLGMETSMLKINAQRDAAKTETIYAHENIVRKQKPHNTAIATRRGELFVGRHGELAHFMPDRIAFTHDHTPVYIMSLTLPYQSDDSGGRRNRAQYHWPFADGSVTLPFSDNSFTLHFAAPQFTGNGAGQRFEYMLEGVDKTWARGTKNAEATYVNVPSGKYTFLLRQAGNTDTASYARLQITVLPPWYRTTLAYAVYALLIVASVLYAQRRYNRRMRRSYDERMKEYQTQQEKANFESKIRFFINLVHEIRTPLTLISLPLEAMEEQLRKPAPEVPAPPSANPHIAAIRRNVNYLLGITNQLLDFQKAENGKMQLSRRRCDVGQLLTDVYRQFEDAMMVQGKRLQLQLPDQPIATAIDVDKVQKVMMNLLGNAAKYARSEIIVRLEQLSLDELRISVIDDGPGVPPAERDNIFDLYYQIGNDSKAATLGTGLGLTYAKMLAKAHDGDLLLSDSVGGGSNFQLVLPIVEVPPPSAPEGATIDPASPTKTIEAPSGAVGGAPPVSHRILIVEDNEELLRMTVDALRPYYRILKAHDGVEALDVLRYQEVDVIVSDVMMPRMDGNELCRRVKHDINFSHIPVILLTAKTSVEAKVEGMESGANIYIEKPFSVKQLHLQIQSLLRMRQNFYERMRQIDSPVAESAGELGMNQQDLQFMERLQQLVSDNMRDEDFSIDLLAEQMNMSRSSFYRKIKALTDMTPIEYLKSRRLEQAAQLLAQGIRITEVAERVGFTSSSYFAKCFKARFGVLPKEYGEKR